jgi:hypothetical protein
MNALAENFVELKVVDYNCNGHAATKRADAGRARRRIESGKHGSSVRGRRAL